MTTRTAYRIYFATGTPFQKDTYTAAEAAQIVAGHPWAWVDRAGDIIVSNYRTGHGADEYTPVTGRQMAARLRRRGQALENIRLGQQRRREREAAARATGQAGGTLTGDARVTGAAP